MKRIALPVTIISLVGIIGAVLGFLLLPADFGVVRAFAAGCGLTIGLLGGVAVARHVVKEEHDPS